MKKWSILAALFAALLLPAAMLGQSAMQANNPAAKQNSVLIDPGVIYNAKDPSLWVGKTVTLKNVNVEDTNDSGNFWVGSDGHHRLLIVKPQSNLNLNALRVHKGDIVTVWGTVQLANDYVAAKTGAEKNSMNDARKSSGVFLLANNVSIASATEH